MQIVTRFSQMSRPIGLLVVAATLLAAVGLVAYAVGLPTVAGATGPAGASDVDTYAAIVSRMREGEDYYAAAHAMLLANGFGTSSVFNWRTPFYPTLLAALPATFWAQLILGAMALCTLSLVHRLAREGGALLAAATTLAVAQSFAPLATPEGVMFAEVPAGLLILFSVVAYARGWRWTGVAAGLLAVFVRELAGVYVLVSLALALRERRWGEALAWVLGLALYAGFFGWHALMVFGQLGPNEPAYPDSWLQFGGLGFILRSAHFDGLLLLAPLWVMGLVLPAALLGLFAWPRAARAGVTVAAYLAVFAVIGKPFNIYWGALYAPLMMLGICWAAPAVAEAVRSRRSS
jgi:hypothetical protein